MKPPSFSPVPRTRLSSTALMAFSTASAPVLTTKCRETPGGAIRSRAAFIRSDTLVWYSEWA